MVTSRERRQGWYAERVVCMSRPLHGWLLQGSAKAVAGPTVCRVTAVMTVSKVQEGVTWSKTEKSVQHNVIVVVMGMVVVIVVVVVTVARCTEKTGRPS